MRSFHVLVIAVLFAACSSSPTAPGEPHSVTLAPGESASILDLNVTFIRVTSDSRCPGDATCITAGDASVAIATTWLGSQREAELWLNNPASQSATHGRYRITFDALAPYPFASRGILPADYRATFHVSTWPR